MTTAWHDITAPPPPVGRRKFVDPVLRVMSQAHGQLNLAGQEYLRQDLDPADDLRIRWLVEEPANGRLGRVAIVEARDGLKVQRRSGRLTVRALTRARPGGTIPVHLALQPTLLSGHRMLVVHGIVKVP
jgi:hypothetical protein